MEKTIDFYIHVISECLLVPFHIIIVIPYLKVSVEQASFMTITLLRNDIGKSFRRNIVTNDYPCTNIKCLCHGTVSH